jgi:putative ABC transport system permease protein
MGSNIIEVFPKGKNITDNEKLILDDIQVIKENVPELKNLSPLTQQYGDVKIGSDSNTGVLVGGNSQLKTLRGIEMVEGRFFSDYEDISRSNVAVVSDFAANKMFKSASKAIGKTFVIKNDKGSAKFTIIGIYKELNPFASMMGDEYPYVIMAPASTVLSFGNTKYLDEIMGTIEDKEIVQSIGIKMVKVLEFAHKAKDKYYAKNSADMLDSINKSLGIVTTVIGAAAGISLIVGGIGIMNIMLVSVKERTREIGIRKALGARNRDIVVQFLTEAVIMTALSGIVGVLIGVLIAFIASKIVKVELPISWGVGVIGFLFSAVFGVFFGVYPAKKAAELDPIEALRYE